MSKLYFTLDERDFFDRVRVHGLLRPKMPCWPIVRFALTQSIRLDSLPDEHYGVPPDRGNALELEQITGFGKEASENYDDEMRFLLSVHHQENLFEDSERYVELLQRHARRGIEFMMAAWQPGRSFHDYLLDELYVDAADSQQSAGKMPRNLDFSALSQGLSQIGVTAAPAGADKEGPRLNRFSLTLASVDDYDRLSKGLDDLAFAMGVGNGGISLVRDQGERRVIVEVPRPSATWHDVTWNSVRVALADRQGLLPVCPGVDVLGQPFIFDLAEAPHLFIAGATGSGKSVCLNALLLSMLVLHRPPEFVLIAPKGVDFVGYDGCVRLRGGKVITDMAAAGGILRALDKEVDDRQKVLREYGARNLAEAQANGASLERIVVVIDELADFMLGKSGAAEPLIRLAQKGRAMGMHLILGSQRPEVATFPGLLRANIPGRIALTVQKAANSRFILDEVGAEKLLMRGDMLIKLVGKASQRAHGVRIDPADIRAVVMEVNRK
jgi:DNA segregation ATPase FtsK/SpoIIIE, S-DNA-T family